MATVVLTAVGTALGGPVGGAIGALIGQRIDHELFGPKGRDGPRLTELAVQTSSYGSAIPWLFGRMRVAGTVIWSTDLIETRSRSGGGKGQASGARYSYAASFAVLLSGRPIQGIGRIWADGRLVRGAAGDLKVKAGLRVHLGGEDQPVDPLIASAEGATPAYRGCAYLVFEDLPLGEFGNRVPSLSVEVIADPGAVTMQDIAGAFGAAADGPAVQGFAASGSVAGVLAVLAQVAGGRWTPDGAMMKLRGDMPPRVLNDAGVMAASGSMEMVRGRQIAAPGRAALAVALRHYDPARDFQAGVQRAGTPGARAEAIDLPAALSAGAAKTLAGAMVARAGVERVRRTVTLGFAGLSVTPGMTVTLAGEAGRWQVLDVLVEAMAVRLTLAPVAPAPQPVAASSGRVAAATDETVGRTLLHVMELPPLEEVLLDRPRVTVVACGTGAGWRRAALLWSVDDGASWTPAGDSGAAGTIGTVERAPARAPSTLIDRAGVMIVRLARAGMVLADADDAALDRGANLAWAGGEMIQFGRAVPMGGGRWRLERLLRGRRGTEADVAAVGDAFILVEPARAIAIDLPMAALGRTVRVMASGVADAVPVEARATVDGRSIRPPAPVRLGWREGVVRWVRRSRLGWTWADRVDVPLGEEREEWRVTIMRADGARRDLVTATNSVAVDLTAGDRVEVRQRGTWAESLPAIWTMGEA